MGAAASAGSPNDPVRPVSLPVDAPQRWRELLLMKHHNRRFGRAIGPHLQRVFARADVDGRAPRGARPGVAGHHGVPRAAGGGARRRRPPRHKAPGKCPLLPRREEFRSGQQQSVTPQICFGGNGRSEGFSPMVRDDDARQRFVAELLALCETVSPPNA